MTVRLKYLEFKNAREYRGKMAEIAKEIGAVKSQMELARARFEFESEPDLVESAIYEMKSLESKYRYLIKTAKQLQGNNNAVM